MRKALAEEKSPLDACLESVLPGVHQWHHANHAAVSSLRQDFTVATQEIKEGIQQIVGELHHSSHNRNKQNIQLATLLEMGQHVLLTGKPSATEVVVNNDNNNSSDVFSTPPRINLLSPPTTMPARTIAIDGNLQESNQHEMEQHKTYVMQPKHNSLVGLLSEWVGVGDYQDDFGGIEGRNQKFGASWRKHLVAFTYSRTERTVKGIREYAQQRGLLDFDACRELQKVYEARKCSVSNMVNYFMEQGLLTKRKPRGKVTRTCQPRNVSPSTPNDVMPL